MMFGRRSAAVSLQAFFVASLICAHPAAGEEPDGESVLFVRGASLMRIALSGKGAPTEVAQLPAGDPAITKMQVSGNGSVLLVESENGSYWVALRADAAPAASATSCPSGAELSPNGRCLVCPASPKTARVVRLASGKSADYQIPSNSIQFLGPAGYSLVAVGDHGIWSFPLRRSKNPERLAPHRPLRAFLPAPNGKRAVGVYPFEDTRTLETFRLDGKAARRTLMRDAEALAWSANSEWLLVEQKNQACIVRAVGGEYKCWRGFTAAAISPDGNFAILAKPTDPPTSKTYDLYRAELAGAHKTRPKLLTERATAPTAAILPAPQN